MEREGLVISSYKLWLTYQYFPPCSLQTVSRVQKANALKSKLKKVFRALDERRTGEVKEALFFSTLAEHSITLEKEDVATVKSRFARNGKLEYLNVLARIAPDLTDLTQQ